MNILITGCGGPAGRALGWQLADSGHTIVGADMNVSFDPLFRTAAAVPAATDPAMLPVLRRLLKKFEIDLLIPTVSDELPSIAAASSSLLTHAAVVISSHASVVLAHDKYLTMAKLASASVPVPRFGLPSDFTSTADALERLGGPFVLKPRISRGGRGVTVVEEPSQIEWATLDDSLIVQEFAPGTEYAPMIYHSTTGPAAPVIAVLEKTKLENGRVGNALLVKRLATDAEPDVVHTSLEAVRSLGLTGPVDMDVRRRSDGTPVVLEINARFGANSRHAPEILHAVLHDFEARAYMEAI